MAIERIGPVRLNLAGMEKYRREVHSALRSTSSGPMLTVRKQWAVRYRSEMQLRFNRFARGGGDWPPLKESTRKKRRQGGGVVSILIDTGQLVNALSPVFSNLDGQFEQGIPFGIEVGFGGNALKKLKDKSTSTTTVAEVAEIHQRGLGNNPVRKILVDPSSKLLKKMGEDMERGLRKMIKRVQVRPV